MTTYLTPVDVRTFDKQDLDGLTATSTELSLPGPERPLAWVVVQEDAPSYAVHFLYDTMDENAAVEAALAYAPGVYGFELKSGMFAVTHGDVADAKVGTYPVEASVESVEAALEDPALCELLVL